MSARTMPSIALLVIKCVVQYSLPKREYRPQQYAVILFLLLSLPVSFIFEPHTGMKTIGAAWLPILYVGVLSSGVAYTLQIIGQKKTEPAVASIVMSLESVFAVLGGWIVFGDVLRGREIGGCVCMFAAVILAQVPQFINRKKVKEG